MNRPGNTLTGIGIWGVYEVQIWEKGGKQELGISGIWDLDKIISRIWDKCVKYDGKWDKEWGNGGGGGCIHI